MLTKIMSFAMAIASRGLTNKKVEIETKQLRYLSCYGNGEISPCSYLKKSQKSDFYYCDKCGCGDNSLTWLVKNPGEYSKLDYPDLNCPIKMPGFSNYDPNFFDRSNKQRKEEIEKTDPEKLKLIQITVNENEQHTRLLETLDKVKKNS